MEGLARRRIWTIAIRKWEPTITGSEEGSTMLKSFFRAICRILMWKNKQNLVMTNSVGLNKRLWAISKVWCILVLSQVCGCENREQWVNLKTSLKKEKKYMLILANICKMCRLCTIHGGCSVHVPAVIFHLTIPMFLSSVFDFSLSWVGSLSSFLGTSSAIHPYSPVHSYFPHVVFSGFLLFF